MVTGMRFQPIGLVIITTQLGSNSAYLAPALVFALIDTVPHVRHRHRVGPPRWSDTHCRGRFDHRAHADTDHTVTARSPTVRQPQVGTSA